MNLEQKCFRNKCQKLLVSAVSIAELIRKRVVYSTSSYIMLIYVNDMIMSGSVVIVVRKM